MKRFEIVDVESAHLSVDEALAKVETEVEILQGLKGEVGGLKIVHGYGSSGTGGEIKRALPGLLKRLKNQRKIKDFFYNESLARGGKDFEKYAKIYPNLMVDGDLKNLNFGVTIVFL